MERLVRVSDKSRGTGVFLFLRDLPPVLEPEARGWTWAIQWMPELIGLRAAEFNLPELEDRVRRDPEGWVLSHEEMYRFDRQVDQVIWGEFIAARSRAALPRPDDPDALVGTTALGGLFAFDSSYWFVGGPARVIEWVRAA